MSTFVPNKNYVARPPSIREGLGWVLAIGLGLTLLVLLAARAGGPMDAKTTDRSFDVGAYGWTDEDGPILPSSPKWMVAAYENQAASQIVDTPDRVLMVASWELVLELLAHERSGELDSSGFGEELMSRGLAWTVSPGDRVFELDQLGDCQKIMVIRGENAGIPGWIHRSKLVPTTFTTRAEAERLAGHTTFAGWADVVGKRLNGVRQFKYELEATNGKRPMVPIACRAWVHRIEGPRAVVTVLEGQYRGWSGYVSRELIRPRQPIGLSRY